MNLKTILKLEKEANKMYDTFEDIASKVKPSYKEPIALQAMLNFSPYYDMIDTINAYWKMRELQLLLKGENNV
jgi:ADP-glucose pyrophosphorylase|tara:strand:- start:1175 stop:1393 length:219 start_codon:yes stop_codon:yes gene_type:complete